MKTTREKIKSYLESGETLNSLKAFQLFNTLSLQQHIHALRKHDIIIKTEMKKNGKTGVLYAEYFLEKK